jgi:hypothetical protein
MVFAAYPMHPVSTVLAGHQSAEKVSAGFGAFVVPLATAENGLDLFEHVSVINNRSWRGG